MSSYYTTISCDEWQRMQDSIRSDSAYAIRNKQEIERLRKQEAELRENLVRRQQQNARAVESAVNIITQAGRVAAHSLAQEVREQVAQQAEDIAGQIDSIRNAAAQANFRISTAAGEIERIAQNYNEMIENIIGRDRQDNARALAILGELDALLEQIRNLHPDVFLQSEYSAVEANRRSVFSNIQSEDYQSAIMLSQGSIITATRILAQLIVMNERYDIYLSDVRESLVALQGRIDILNSSEGRITLVLGEELETEYDIDYWSNGMYGELVSEVNRITEQIAYSDRKPMPLDQISRLGERIQRLDEQLTICDNEARTELASSIAVENTAQRLYDNLTERGWNLENSGRKDDDSRKPYTMTYEDGTGNTVSIVVATGKDPDRPSFFYEAFSENDGMASLVKEGIGAALEEEGLNPENTVHRNDCQNNPEPEIFIDRVSQEAESLVRERRTFIRNEMKH